MERTPQAALTHRSSLAMSGDGLRLLAASADSPCLHVSKDGGASWQQTACTGGWSAVAMSADGSRMFVGNSNKKKVLASSDGASWSACGSIGPPEEALGVFSIAASADGRRVVSSISPFANIYSGSFVYTSSDNCATWVKR